MKIGGCQHVTDWTCNTRNSTGYAQIFPIIGTTQGNRVLAIGRCLSMLVFRWKTNGLHEDFLPTCK